MALSINFLRNSVSSYELSSKEVTAYIGCYQEICDKTPEASIPLPYNQKVELSEEWKSQIQKFSDEYTENELKIQRLVKSNILKIGNGFLGGFSNQGDTLQLAYSEVFEYYSAVMKNFRAGSSLDEFFQQPFDKISNEDLRSKPHFLSLARRRRFFEEIKMIRSIRYRSDLREVSELLVPTESSFDERLLYISNEVLNFYNGNQGVFLGDGLRYKSWAIHQYLENKIIYERSFLHDVRSYLWSKLASKFPTSKFDLAKTGEIFRNFSQRSEFRLIYNRDYYYDLERNFDMRCEDGLATELYWASSDLRNRVSEKYFEEFKEVSKTFFTFDSQEVKERFDNELDRLEMIKGRSFQDVKAHYPFYFKMMLESQNKAIQLLEGGDFIKTSNFLHAYISSLPQLDEGVDEENSLEFIDKLSFSNSTCPKRGDYGFLNTEYTRGSFFTSYRWFVYLELSSMKKFKYGVFSLGHELGHAISYIINNPELEIRPYIDSSLWSFRSCINEKYPASDQRSSSGERYQTEEDWADYFAVELLKVYKSNRNASWIGNTPYCNNISTNDLSSKEDPLQPFGFGTEYEGRHSSDLFRLIAQEYYSRGELGPVCTSLVQDKGLFKCKNPKSK